MLPLCVDSLPPSVSWSLGLRPSSAVHFYPPPGLGLDGLHCAKVALSTHSHAGGPSGGVPLPGNRGRARPVRSTFLGPELIAAGAEHGACLYTGVCRLLLALVALSFAEYNSYDVSTD